MPTLMKATNKQLQQAQRECAEHRQDSEPITPYRRGFEDCFYKRVFANPYQIGSDDAAEYHCGYGDARLMHYLNRTCCVSTRQTQWIGCWLSGGGQRRLSAFACRRVWW